MSRASIERCLNIADLRNAARRRAHPMVFHYIDGAAGDEKTLRWNASAFDHYEFLYRVLVGVSNIETRTTLLGTEMKLPFFPSSSAANRLFHTEGERAVASAADKMGIPYCLSTLGSVSIEDVARVKSGTKWFQLYVWRDRQLVKEMLVRAREAGFSALILTVDFPVAGNREREARYGFSVPPRIGLRQVYHACIRPAWTWDYLFSEPIRYANLSGDQAAVSLAQFVDDQMHAGFSWKDAEWLLAEWNGPSFIKGVVHKDDARAAVDMGFNGVIVSNHGGRQLDGSVAPMDVLEEIADHVGNDAELVLDGGVRRGIDILKALALGARAVSFARPYLYGLAGGGERGVLRAFQILAAELRKDMALLGATRISEIGASCIRRRR